ncbi:MAG: hypothetical protein KDD70_08850 [Bdellovibrionales bacterium]|nr:hypothetical protein [Bdellovibrionales bacterium]
MRIIPRVLILSLSIPLLLGGCSVPMEVAPMSDFERIPAPLFTAYAPDQAGQQGKYTDIKVYERRNECTPPQCPLRWHVNLNPRQSPTMFRYGYIPGFGLNTLRSQDPLQVNTEYVLVLSERFQKDEDVKGELYFRIDEQGVVVPLEHGEE